MQGSNIIGVVALSIHGLCLASIQPIKCGLVSRAGVVDFPCSDIDLEKYFLLILEVVGGIDFLVGSNCLLHSSFVFVFKRSTGSYFYLFFDLETFKFRQRQS